MWYWRFCTCRKFKWYGRITIFVYQVFDWKNQKILSVIYINAKWIYASKTLACTIKECVIVRNIFHVTSTCPFISWCSGDANVKWTPQIWHLSLKYVEVNLHTCICWNIFQISPSKFIYFSRSRLEHIQLIHQLFCGNFIQTKKFWNFLACINN